MGMNRISKIVSLMIIVTFLAAGCSSGKSYINTSVGEITVKRFEIVDEFSGQKAKFGFEILLIFFVGKDGETKDGFNEAANNVFLTTLFGNRIEKFVGGTILRENLLGFVIPDWASVLMLNWPGNDPIQIEIER